MAELDVVAAYDGKLVDTLEYQSEAEVMECLDQAFGLFQDRSSWLVPYQRIDFLEKATKIIDERKEDFILTAAQEGGKPYDDSKIELERAIEGLKIAVRELSQLSGREIPMGLTSSSTSRLAHTIREPRGVVLGISAFNHPINLIIHQVIPAIAVGCPVLIKPALTTPLSCKNLVDALHEAGLPRGWCSMILCEDEIAEKIAADPRIAFLSFIGSAPVGWRLRSQLAEGAACTLEHGGVAPVIFDAGADIDQSIAPLVKGGYYHAGQVCVSVQRIYIYEQHADEFIEKFTREVQRLNVGDPTVEGIDVGPLILPREVDRVERWVDDAVNAGGKLLQGGERLSDTCYRPTVVMNPPDDARVSQEEIFGPVVNLYTYHDRDDAIRRANGSRASFQAAVFTDSLDVAYDTARRLNASAVMINDHTAFRVDWMPFGGTKQSGLGVGGIGYSMRDMTYEKLIVIKSSVF